jgi:hypothetical protein
MHYFLVNPEFFFFVIFINYVNTESPRTFHTHIIFDISSSTISDILKQKTKDKINKLEDIDNDFNFRIRDGKYHALEECVFEWIMLMNRSNVPINDDLIQSKAKEFAE